MKTMRPLPDLLLLLLSLATSLPAFAQVSAALCGPLKGSHYGPYDYRPDHQKNAGSDPMPHAEKRVLVEGAHFTPRVENLIGAQSGGQVGPPGQDLSYTLRAFPNNHRALVAVVRYGEKFKTETPAGLQYPVECYFERAIRFASNDHIVRIIYATYLTQKNRRDNALQQLQVATDLAETSPFAQFNIGLAYFDLKDYPHALQSAHRAMALGFPRRDLQDKLSSVGQWQEPVSAETSAEVAASAPALPASAASAAAASASSNKP